MRFCWFHFEQQPNQKSVNTSLNHNNTGSAENQQPLIGDNHLQNKSKTGSFLSHLAREFTGRASSSTASESPAMKSTSRNNSSGSNCSGGVSGVKRNTRKQQNSYSGSSVCEEAREIEDIPNSSMLNEPIATTSSRNDTNNAAETETETDTKDETETETETVK